MITFQELAQGLQMASKAIMMYTPKHPRALAAAEQLLVHLNAWLTEQPYLQIVASNHKLFVDGVPFEGNNTHVATLCRQLMDRQISGISIQRGVPPEEVMGLLEILHLKPAKIEESGGAGALFELRHMRFITLTQTQYLEVRDGVGGQTKEWGSEGPEEAGLGLGGESEIAGTMDIGLVGNPSTTEEMLNAGEQKEKWTEELQSSLMDPGLDDFLGETPKEPWNPPFPGALPPANLAGLGAVAEDLGWGPTFPSGDQLEAFRQALLDLAAEQQMAVLSGQDSLSKTPVSLRQSFQALAPELFAAASSKLIAKGVEWQQVQEAVYDSLKQSNQKQAMVEALASQLTAQGLDMAHVDSLIRQLDWDGQPFETKLRRVLEQREMWELALDQRLAFIRELIDNQQLEPLLMVLEQVMDSLKHENARIREAAALTLRGVAQWFWDPGIPMEAEVMVVDGLKAHFGWEPVLSVHRATTDALEAVMECFVLREEFLQTRDLHHELESLSEMLGDQQDWRASALNRLRARLLQKDLVDATLFALFRVESLELMNVLVPYLEFLGPKGSALLVGHLVEEGDRRRRSRLMEAIRAMGGEALPALRESLSSKVWFVVRNTLVLLSELGDAGLLPEISQCLRFQDLRVRQAAVRAMWKIGGPAAEVPLIDFLPSTDPDTQMEVVFALGQLQSQRAIPALLALAASSQRPEGLRVKALDVVGLVGRPEAQQPLVELIRRKGRIFTSAEPLPIRLAAARALVALHTPQALEALARLGHAEPRGQARDALLALAQGR
jgi:hypothetical protein